MKYKETILKHELIRRQEKLSCDLRHDIFILDSIIRKKQKEDIKRLKSDIWYKDKEHEAYKVKIPKTQTRLKWNIIYIKKD